MAAIRKKILFADFFGTVKERGIAAYVRDLEAIAAELGAETVMLRAPAWVRRLPQAIQNLLMVLHEQLAVPLQALRHRPDLIVFPYNSSSFLLSFSQRTVCVIHDLIPYRSRNRGSGLAFAYVACSARWHARLRRRFVAVSPFTARTLRAVPRFARCPVITIPNCFTALPPSAKTSGRPVPRRRVTLISGVGSNKAFAQALELMSAATVDGRLADLGYDVVGFGPDHPRAAAMVEEARGRGLPLPPIMIHPLLPRDDLDVLIAENAVTWAHTLAEGFGRVVVEGRAAGRPVVMSRLPVFRALADPFTFSYSNADSAEFRRALHDALNASGAPRPYRLVEQLRADATAGFEELLSL